MAFSALNRTGRLILTLLACLVLPIVHAAPPQFVLPQSHLGPADLAVIVNDDDPLSREIGQYYQSRRGIPEKNMIHVRFLPGGSVMSHEEFARIKSQVDRVTPDSVQAFALTWSAPYRVDCMSITSAFAFGFAKSYCAEGCSATRASPYFDSSSLAPNRDFKIRPTMALAGTNLEAVKALIDRGIASDDSHPAGTGYLVSTDDKARNVRAVFYPAIVKSARSWVRLQVVRQDYIQDKQDVLFYFTGLAQVPKLDSLRFVPGAIADHLTSAGGELTDSWQMSSLRWLEAGATGSYGAVDEPCNFLQKFPNPGLVIGWYLRGESLLEAYWKSVAWPGQGIFIGEPLAAPFAGYRVAVDDRGEILLRTQALPPGTYALLGANSPVGPYTEPRALVVTQDMQSINLGKLDKPFYRIIAVH